MAHSLDAIRQVIDDPFSRTLLYYLLTLFGAVAMYIFSSAKGFEGSIKFLQRLFPGKPTTFYERADFFLVTIFGSIIGTVFFCPTSAIQALAAGFGWVGAVNVLMKPGEKQL